MKTAMALVLLGSGLLAGCASAPEPRERVRIVNSPADVAACRRVARVGDAVRTDGIATLAARRQGQVLPAASDDVGDFGLRADAMRDEALRLGATDLLLQRRFGRDWAYVSGTAYRCRR